MKTKIYIFLSIFLFLNSKGYSTIWQITNSMTATAFSPTSITITFGDSVNFVLESNHNALEVSFATWSIDDNTALSGGFETPYGGGMVLPSNLSVGDHYYVCFPHASVGMKGMITVLPCTPPSQPGSISGNTTVCSGTVYVYSIAAVSGATSYTWVLPGGWAGSSTTNSISSTSSNTSGNITVSANNSCGSSVVKTLSITANNIPVQPGSITGNISVCSGSSNIYSISAVPAATSYTWNLPVGWSGNSTTNSITAIAGTTGGNITVTANNSCGSSALKLINVSVSTSIPLQPGTISGNINICASSLNTYNINIVAGASSYTWTLPVGWTGNSTSNSISIIAGTNTGVITVTANNACGSSTAQILNVVVGGGSAPAQPGNISGDSIICSGTSNSYNIVDVPTALSYTWTLPGGWVGTSITSSITATANANSGNILVSANNACGSSAPQIVNITVNSIPSTPGSITGNLNNCFGSSSVYSITLVPGATNYIWTLPSGWIGISNTNTINAVAGTAGGTISVIANNNCGSSLAQNLNVTSNQVDTSVSISGVTLNANANVAIYQWINCSGNIPVSGQTNQSFTPAANGNYAVIVTQSSCSDTSSCFLITNVGIEENSDFNYVNIYPNPSNGKFLIEMNHFENVNLEIYNMLGEKILQNALKNSRSELDISMQKNGIYYLKIYDGQNVIIKKMLIQ